MTTVRRPDWMTAVADGYIAECAECGWRQKYAKKASARGGLSAHHCSPQSWRRCSSCLGVCHWHDTDWVCRECGDEWGPDLLGWPDGSGPSDGYPDAIDSA